MCVVVVLITISDIARCKFWYAYRHCPSSRDGQSHRRALCCPRRSDCGRRIGAVQLTFECRGAALTVMVQSSVAEALAVVQYMRGCRNGRTPLARRRASW